MDTWKTMAEHELTRGPQVPSLGNEISQLKLGISVAVEELYEAYREGRDITEALGVLMTLQGELKERKAD